MKILVVECEPTWHHTLPAGLRQVGCAVRILKDLNHEHDLTGALAEFQPDCVLMMGWTRTHEQPRRAVIRRVLDRTRTPLVYWAVEDRYFHRRWSLPFVREMRPDLVVSINAECVARYRALGFRAGYVTLGYNHELFRPLPPRPEYACTVAVVATLYRPEPRWFRWRSLRDLVVPLLGSGHDVKIWGKYWDQAARYGLQLPRGVWQGALDYTDSPHVYASAQMVVGPQNDEDTPSQVTMRTFEVMGCGAFLLTSRTAGVRRLFRHDQHLAMSTGSGQTLQLVQHYLSHPDQRARVAAAGQAEVAAKHTYAMRAREFLDLYHRLMRA